MSRLVHILTDDGKGILCGELDPEKQDHAVDLSKADLATCPDCLVAYEQMTAAAADQADDASSSKASL